ncbi:MAG: hypothetical protein H6739_19365 [Alphaproteobacteria bacterium]|nr:hypothetical protein [Alphaproteobacteria bacterium]
MSAELLDLTAVDALVRGLGSPPPPPEPPPWADGLPGWGETLRAWARSAALPLGTPMLALAALLLGVGLPAPTPETPAVRGVSTASAPWVSLDLLIEQDGRARRLGALPEVRVGDRAFFRVAAGGTTALTVWVEGPGGVAPVGALDAGPETADLAADGGLTAWRFDRPGRYTFHASPAAGVCVAPACASRVVEVR